ncbi:MAG: hypothetical protein QXS50_04200 [Candidatus Caldarchaeum sp.]
MIEDQKQKEKEEPNTTKEKLLKETQDTKHKEAVGHEVSEAGSIAGILITELRGSRRNVSNAKNAEKRKQLIRIKRDE